MHKYTYTMYLLKTALRQKILYPLRYRHIVKHGHRAGRVGLGYPLKLSAPTPTPRFRVNAPPPAPYGL
jgi:hypothetical protein